MISFIFTTRQPIRIIFVLIYAMCIVALSLLPMRDLPQIPEFRGFDKLVHFTMYFIFSTLFCWALKAELNYLWLLLIIPVTVGWGVFMEFMQQRMHLGRNFDVYDMIANSVGVFIGLLLYLLIARKFSKAY